MIDYYLDQVAQALSRTEFDIYELRKGENAWELDPSDGMYMFKGQIADFLVQKHTIDLLREVWHLNDGTRELINAKWAAGLINVADTDLDKGRGPGRTIVNKHVASCPSIQLCGDLANLTKHYKLSRATKTGNAPPQLDATALTIKTSGKLDILRDETGDRALRFERPMPFRPTMIVLDEQGNQIGDAVEIAVKARESWISLLAKCGFTFAKPGDAPVN